MNVHLYDGKLDLYIATKIVEVYFLTVEEKRHKGQSLLDSLEDKLSPVALRNLRRLVSDIGTSANIDNTHSIVFPDGKRIPLCVDDLLCLCYENKLNEDFIKEFEIQLIDMSTGMCAQGRTHRIVQILTAFLA